MRSSIGSIGKRGQTNEGREIGRRSYLGGLARVGAVTVTGTVVSSAPAAADSDARSGPITLVGFPTARGWDGLWPFEVLFGLIGSVIVGVSNGGEGVLVIGEESFEAIGYNTTNMFWGDVDLFGITDHDVTFVAGPEEIAAVEFDGYEMLAVVSSAPTMTDTPWASPPEGEGLNEAENRALIDRSNDVAAFVRDGGGLYGSTQTGLRDPWCYLRDLGEFETITGLEYDSIETTEGWDEQFSPSLTGEMNTCCWHDVFTGWPKGIDALVWREGFSGEQAGIVTGSVSDGRRRKRSPTKGRGVGRDRAKPSDPPAARDARSRRDCRPRAARRRRQGRPHRG
jgi:hypothetical protein